MDPGFGEIERLFTPHFARGRGGDRPRAIVVHTTAGTFAGTADWFADPESGVSAHYLVALDGRVAQFVDETDAARHAGRVLDPTASIAQGRDDLNPMTIGIELEDGGDAEHVERPDAQYAAAAALIAAAGERWGIPIDREHVIGHREAFAAKACPGNVDVERLVALAASAPRGAPKRGREPTLLCLLPIRDGAEDLPGYLSSIEALSADVLALDDGSADGSAQLLRAHPRVIEVLRREAEAPTWDDAANRQALLDRAAATDYDWLLFLDVDERVDPDDAAALRQFLATDAIAGLAYGLQLHRAWGERVDPNPRYVYRLFGRAEEMTLPAERLHLNPVPLEVSRRAWVRTSIRVRHLESAGRLDRRRAKYDRADPDGAHRAHTETMLAPPPEHLVEWPPRPAGLAVVGGAKAPPAGGREAADTSRPLLVCLLAVRNGAADLEGYLESAERFADAVVALDDGSTDATAELLAAAPLVRKLIRNPRRDSYAGWDDAANRQALLDAASELEPRWVVFVDADERIDPDDAAALRGFAARDAIPGDAYGFRVHRMIGTLDRYDRADLWAYRMFAHEPGMRLPAETLHLVPVPDSIPRARWRSTTVRIQHLAGLDEGRRRERLRKYEQADPGRVWQRDYERILETDPVRPWVPRPPGLPVLLAGRNRARMSGDDLDLEAPRLSAIVISHNDEARIERAVRSVVQQRCDEPFEVIVVVSGTDRTAAVVAAEFPDVTLIDLGKRALPGRARNAGVAGGPRRLRLVPRVARGAPAGKPRRPDRRSRGGLADGHGIDPQRHRDPVRLGLVLPRPLELAAGPALRRARRRPRALLVRAPVRRRDRRLPRATCGPARTRSSTRRSGAVAIAPIAPARSRSCTAVPAPIRCGSCATTSSAAARWPGSFASAARAGRRVDGQASCAATHAAGSPPPTAASPTGAATCDRATRPHAASSSSGSRPPMPGPRSSGGSGGQPAAEDASSSLTVTGRRPRSRNPSTIAGRASRVARQSGRS